MLVTFGYVCSCVGDTRFQDMHLDMGDMMTGNCMMPFFVCYLIYDLSYYNTTELNVKDFSAIFITSLAMI